MATEQSMDAALALVQGLFTDREGIKRVLEFLAEAAMEQEVTGHLSAGRHERAGDRRRGYRNGSKPRTLNTRVGRLELSVPQVRECDRGPYEPSLFGKFQRSERALLVACGEMYFQGVSTRKVQEVLSAMCGEGVELSAMTVSRVAAELDGKLAAFRSRRLDHTSWPYVQIDARYEKVRVDGRVVSRAVLTTVGFDACGRREILDWRVADSESAQSWGELFKGLKDRGLSGVKLITSDAHGGIRAAIERHFQGASWQRCQVHFKRELSAKVPYKRRKEAMDDLRSVLAGHDRAECLRRGEEMAGKWEGSYPAVGKMVREGLEDCLAVLGFPEEHRVRLGSTNLLENLMRQLKRRTGVVGVFPNEASCDRLVGTLLLEVHEGWLTEERRQFNMELTR